MRIVKKIILFAGLMTFFWACDRNFIDPITKVDPGPDENAPEVIINFPPDGYQLSTNDEIASINIDFEASDDIEIASVKVSIDGGEIATYDEFMDFRNVKETLLYDNVTSGDHILEVEAVDIEGKTTTAVSNFSKAPPYVSPYEGEVFYMPFNNEYLDMVSLTQATTVGSPGFDAGIQGGTAYKGAADSYLSFPSGTFQGNEVSASFWMKINAVPDRAGILVIGPPDDSNNLRTSGFRFFRENANGMQRYKLNVGTGDGESWFDGGAAADVDPTTNEWVHFAFTISQTDAHVYIDGELVTTGTFSGIDWTNCSSLSIMSGVPNFSGWDHLSDESMMDELRLFNIALTQEEIQTIMLKEQATFHMDFNGDYADNISGTQATEEGSPSFEYSGGVKGDAYKGATDSYLSFPSTDLQQGELSASFWMKINAVPNRAGILVIGPPDDSNNLRTSGFRFFRENAGDMQRFKLNVGTGDGESWFDGGAAADVDPTSNNWVHFAVVIGAAESRVYIDGVEVTQGAFTGVDWTNCSSLSIMSGVPNFSGWDHLSDESLMDELFLFDKALTVEEVTLLMNDGL